MASGKKKVLGRGLAALIPTGEDQPRLGSAAADVVINGGKVKNTNNNPLEASYREIPINDINPNPKQPRIEFEPGELAELTHSIKEFGLLQPIVVRPVGNKFELVMGERRWRASKEAKLQYIPAIIKETSDQNMLRDALLENIHRVQLNPLEEAAAYQQLLEEFNVTHEELADRLGRSRPTVSNLIRLLKLAVPVQRQVVAGELSAGHARTLLALDDLAEQEVLAKKIIAEGLSVRGAEQAVATFKSKGNKDKNNKPNITIPKIDDLAKKLSAKYEAKTAIKLGKKKGKITIEFDSVSDLERIYKQLME